MAQLQQLLGGVLQAWSSGDGHRLSAAFILPLRPHPLPADVRNAQSNGHDLDALAAGVLEGQAGGDFVETVGAYLQALSALAQGSWERVFAQLHRAFDAYSKTLQGAQDPDFVAFLLPTLKVLARHLNLAATRADAGAEGFKSLRKAENTLKNCFTDMLKDRSGARKPVLLCIAAQLFQVYSRMSNIPFAKTLVNTLKRPTTLQGVQQVKADIITYNYHCGRLFVFEDQFQEAESYLGSAFEGCHKDAVGNKRRILAYLVPVRILLGRMPTDRLLDKYGLPHFKGICRGIRTGNLRLFEQALADNQELFIRQGNFLILERTRKLCYRTLFRNLQKAAGYGPENTRVRLGDCEAAFRWMNCDSEPEQIECILANLIHKGIIKGYIAHAQRLLVLKRNGDPFPREAIASTS